MVVSLGIPIVYVIDQSRNFLKPMCVVLKINRYPSFCTPNRYRCVLIGLKSEQGMGEGSNNDVHILELLHLIVSYATKLACFRFLTGQTVEGSGVIGGQRTHLRNGSNFTDSKSELRSWLPLEINQVNIDCAVLSRIVNPSRLIPGSNQSLIVEFSVIVLVDMQPMLGIARWTVGRVTT